MSPDPPLGNNPDDRTVGYWPVPTVDVIIPAFNAQKHLAAALDSVLAQTFEDWRILLVNDGSTDATGEIAARYQQRLQGKMQVITQANAGLPAARNAAIRHASAEFLAILDSDDVWLPCRLSESLSAFEGRPQVGLSYGLVTRIDEQDRPLFTFKGNPHHAEGRIAPYIYMRRVEFPCPTVMFRRRCVEEVGVFDETMRATEDRDLWLRIAFRYEIAFVPKVIALYRTYATSMSADMDRMLSSQLMFIRKHYGAPGCGLIPRLIAVSRAYKQRGEVFRERGRPWKALQSALRACLIWPLGQENLRTAASLLLNCTGLRRAS